MRKEVMQIGNIYGFDGGNYAGNVYEKEGLCPTIRANSGGNTQPMIIVSEFAGGGTANIYQAKQYASSVAMRESDSFKTDAAEHCGQKNQGEIKG